MKSSPKVNPSSASLPTWNPSDLNAEPSVHPNASLPTWNPSDLNAESSAHPQNMNKEKVLAIFQSEDATSVDQEKGEEKNSLPSKKKGTNYAKWQPGLLDQQPELPNRYEWDFIEVSDSPFNKAWKVQKPNTFSDLDVPTLDEPASSDVFTQSENEIAILLEQARNQADEIILSAQAEADELLLQAESEIGEQKKEAYQQGRDEALAEMKVSLNAVRKMSEEIEVWKTELLAQGETILVDMLKDISRKMFGEGVKLDAQALHSNLNRIMENAHGLGALKVFLNPHDARLLDPSWDEQQMLSLGEQVKIIPAGNVLPGGCLIKGNIGTVDGRVEVQLNAILKTFDDSDK